MNNHGRVLLIKSSTEPLVRIMTEGKNKDLALKAAQMIKKVIEA